MRQRARMYLASVAVTVCLSAAMGCASKQAPPSLDPARVPSGGSARRALLAAETAAAAWQHDAQLLYIENDRALSAAGQSAGWSFLFHSVATDSWWQVGVRGGRVENEGTLEFPYPAPPLPAEWIDSDQAVQLAEAAGGAEFRGSAAAALAHALLCRGVFDEQDAATWTVIYRSPTEGELAIVIDAVTGVVVNQFEG